MPTYHICDFFAEGTTKLLKIKNSYKITKILKYMNDSKIN